MSRRALLLFVVVAVAGLALAACGGDEGTDSGGTAKTFTIGYTGTLSGEFASFATEGKQGVELAIEEINAAGGIDGAQVEMVSADDRGEPAQGPVIAQQFADNEEIKAVIGYSFSSVALAAVPIYDRSGLPVVGTAVTSPELSGSSKYFFRTILTDAVQGTQMGQYCVTVGGAMKISTLHQVDDYGNGVTQAFEAAATAEGAEIVSSDGYQLGTKDFKSQLTKIKDTNPDAIFLGSFYPEAAKIATQARQLGMEQPIFGTDGSLSPTLIELGKDAVEGMIVYGMFHPSAGETNPKVGEFVDAFKAKFGIEPSSFVATAYDAMYAVKAAAEQVGMSRDEVQQGLVDLSGLEGVTGSVSFNDEGDREGDVLFLVVQDGQFTVAEQQLK